jgi:hypothetical protein
MQVQIDEVWATPSTLHVKVTVSADDYRWRYRAYPSIPLKEVPTEALTMLLAFVMDEVPEEDHHQTALF